MEHINNPKKPTKQPKSHIELVVHSIIVASVLVVYINHLYDS